MRKALTALAMTTAAFAAPMLSTGTAYAMTDPNLDYFNTSVDLSNLVDLVATKPLCATTLVNGISTARPGVPKVVSLYPVLNVDLRPTDAYVVTVEGVTVGFIICTLT